ncbi:transcriptional regulator [Pseudoclavibacter endophyticus]|uniref:PadR family transcriptional regulator n=1 Tax=Pseudoclavibacter endophyticus TaxID=1778590 RepID=A0A6H9WHV3_9MICO|nr:helix-turn-helix transcriptional regulator [Pseudoclavibacter endophyticus]KAB1648883.1 PadR family transcriptional regulator [Pseudoclavibacter endophyticus]GGA67533.1 transcriptional regulator [Pseudoclavibacter endophyticus]
MIGSDLIRGSLDLVILSVLLEGESYGYAIAKRIDERSRGDYVVKETTLYAAIRRLEARGDLESFPGVETNGRPRTYYRITDEGAARHHDKREEWRHATDVVARFLASDGS